MSNLPGLLFALKSWKLFCRPYCNRPNLASLPIMTRVKIWRISVVHHGCLITQATPTFNILVSFSRLLIAVINALFIFALAILGMIAIYWSWKSARMLLLYHKQSSPRASVMTWSHHCTVKSGLHFMTKWIWCLDIWFFQMYYCKHKPSSQRLLH